MMINYKIYALRLISDQEVRYIGQTIQSLQTRFRAHKKEKNRNPHKVSWMMKNKGNIEIVLIEDGIKTLEEANKTELYYIDFYRKEGANLLNKTNGGDGVKIFSSWNKGKNCTYIDKLIENSPRSKKVYYYDLNGFYVGEFRSVKFASISLGVSRCGIINIANFKPCFKQSKGYMFRWEKSDKIQPVFYDEELRGKNISLGRIGKKYKVCEKLNG